MLLSIQFWEENDSLVEFICKNGQCVCARHWAMYFKNILFNPHNHSGNRWCYIGKPESWRNKDQSHTDKRGGAQILPWEMITMMMTKTIMVMIQQE